jgi:hypothetical protein
MVNIQDIEDMVKIRVELAKAQALVNQVMTGLQDHRDDASIEAFLDMLDRAADSIVDSVNML